MRWPCIKLACGFSAVQVLLLLASLVVVKCSTSSSDIISERESSLAIQQATGVSGDIAAAAAAAALPVPAITTTATTTTTTTESDGPRDRRRPGKILDQSLSANNNNNNSKLSHLLQAHRRRISSITTTTTTTRQESQDEQQQQQDHQQPQVRSHLPALRFLIVQSQAAPHKQVLDARSSSTVALNHNNVSKDEEDELSRAPTSSSSSSSSSSLLSPVAAAAARQAKCVTAAPASKVKALIRDFLLASRSFVGTGFRSLEQRAGNFFPFSSLSLSNLLAALIPLVSVFDFGHSPRRLTSGGETAAPLSANLSVSTSTSKDQTTLAAQGAAQQHGIPTSQYVTKLISESGSGTTTTSGSNAGGIQSRVEKVIDWFEQTAEHLPHFPRLHPQECIKRTICEAYEAPSKYGAIGLALRLLIPAPGDLGDTDRRQDSMEYKVINKYRYAAGYGTSRRLMEEAAAAAAAQGTGASAISSSFVNNSDNNGTARTSREAGSSGGAPPPFALTPCKAKYDECMVSLLDVAQRLMDAFLSKS